MRNHKANAIHFLLKRNLFIGVAVFLCVFYMIPFWGLSHIANTKMSILENTEAQHQAMQFQNLVSSQVMFAASQEIITIAFGTLGFLTALMLFRHLFSRRQGMIYAALPDKRETDFGRRMLCYGILCIFPIFVNLILYLMIVTGNGLISYMDWGKLLGRFGVLVLVNAYGFAVGLLASVLTGTYWAALLAGAVIIIGTEGLVFIWQYLADMYLHTLPNLFFTDLLKGFSPAYTLYKGLYDPQVFAWLPGFAAILVAIGASFILYRIRKTEMVERTLAFSCLHPIMGFVLPLMGGSMMGIVIMMSFGNEMGLILGFVTGAALTYWIGRMAFNQRFCGILKGWYLPGAAAAVLCLSALMLHVDAFGFDRFMPQREALTAISYRPQAYQTDEKITLTSQDALDAAYAWCTLMRDEAESLESGLSASALADSSSAVVVTYHYNGKTARRYYPNRKVRNEAQPYLKTIIESDDYKNSILENTMPPDVKQISYMYLHASSQALWDESFYEKHGIYPYHKQMTPENDAPLMQSLLSALEKDIQARTLETKKDEAMFRLQFQYEDPQTGHGNYRSVNIYPTDINVLTAAFGEKAQLMIDYATGGFAASENIVALKVTYALNREDARQSGIPDEEMVQSVAVSTGPDQVAEWLDKCQNTSAYRYYFMPDFENKSYSLLYLYNLEAVERYQTTYGNEIPQDKSQFYKIPVPTLATMSFIGE